MAEGEQGRRPDWSKYPRWVQYLPGFLGAGWLIGSLSWFMWAQVLPANASFLTKATQSGICLSGIAFAISGLWPVGGKGQLKPEDIPDFWAFIKAPSPSPPHLKAVHTKFRVSLAILLIFVSFMVAHATVLSLGLGRAE